MLINKRMFLPLWSRHLLVMSTLKRLSKCSVSNNKGTISWKLCTSVSAAIHHFLTQLWCLKILPGFLSLFLCTAEPLTCALCAYGHHLLASIKQKKFRVKSENAKDRFSAQDKHAAYHLEPHDMKWFENMCYSFQVPRKMAILSNLGVCQRCHFTKCSYGHKKGSFRVD